MEDGNGNSLCDVGNVDSLARVIKYVYLDAPSKANYTFRVNPPKLDGQIGVPKLVDQILGNISQLFISMIWTDHHLIFEFMSYFSLDSGILPIFVFYLPALSYEYLVSDTLLQYNYH